jgi:hypothetical protein
MQWEGLSRGLKYKHVLHWASFYGRTEVVTLLLAHRSAGGAPAAKTLRQGGKWGCWVKQHDVAKEEWCALAEWPGWLAAVRRRGAMAARAVCRRSS